VIVGVVLAAGRGTRFGGAKLLQPLRGRPLLSYAVDAALHSHLDRVIVVRPEARPEFETAVDCSAARLGYLSNPDPARGQMSSLKIALGSMAATVEAAVVLLADMPLVGSPLIDALLTSFRNDGRSVVPVCEGQWRHPRLLSAELFPEFLALRDDARGNELLEARRTQIGTLEFADARQFLDVDRPGDLAQVERLLASGA
jgi:molybdenum cofactor cytidylyltransferase